jgi:GTPase SAR1 family protein
MAIIGLMGAMNVGKTAVLKMFVDYIEKNKISKIKGGMECKLEKVDFKGESTIEVEDGDGFSKTITPNKVVFTEVKNGMSHTLFAPGGDRDRAVIRMGIITISRIAREIVGLFALDESLKDQFKLYDLIRYMPKKIFVCLNKYDLLEGTDEEKEKVLEEKKEMITNYFKKRRIIVEGFFLTCAIDKPNFLEFNDNVGRMILDLVKKE